MLNLESQCIPVVLGGILVIKTLPNHNLDARGVGKSGFVWLWCGVIQVKSQGKTMFSLSNLIFSLTFKCHFFPDSEIFSLLFLFREKGNDKRMKRTTGDYFQHWGVYNSDPTVHWCYFIILNNIFWQQKCPLNDDDVRLMMNPTWSNLSFLEQDFMTNIITYVLCL